LAAEFQPYTFEIEKEDGCSPGGDAISAMIIETHAHHIPKPLQGQVGGYPNGRIAPPSDASYSLTSRFPLPASIPIAGRARRLIRAAG